MPGPGAHMMYTMGSSLALTSMTSGRFGPHHTLTYSINAFFGPDMGSFAQWLGSTLEDITSMSFSFGSILEDIIHHPLYYIIVLGFPLCVLYSWLSKKMLQRGFLDSGSGAPLTRRQCLFLVAAGSLSHFFLDHLFEENGHSTMYTWILSTGWWETRAPINPDAVFVVSFLCTCLIGAYIYINRVKRMDTLKNQLSQSVKLIIVIASLYCLWCASQIYLVNPRRPAVGEEADLGVIIFLAIYFFLPHWLCILSMNSREYMDAQQLPL